MNEDALRALFQHDRRVDAAHAPAFDRTLAGARRRSWRPRRPLLVPAVAAAALGVIAAGVGVWLRAGRSPTLVSLAAAQWDAPTDFLLETPGAELLRVTPQLGVHTILPSQPDTDIRER